MRYQILNDISREVINEGDRGLAETALIGHPDPTNMLNVMEAAAGRGGHSSRIFRSLGVAIKVLAK